MKKLLPFMLALLMLFASPARAAGDGDAAAFSLELFAASLESGEPNAAISPLSAYLALSLAALGAGGDTRADFAAVLGRSADELAAYCAALEQSLAQTGGGTSVRIGNSAWLDERFRANPDYLELAERAMNARVFVEDLDTDAARGAINAWVSDATGGLIPSLLDTNLSEDAMLALVNTLYFKAAWRDPFPSYGTGERTFYLEGGGSVQAEFMGDSDCLRAHISSAGAEGVLLPYEDGKTALLALRPTDGRTVRELALSLTPDSLAGYIQSAQQTRMSLSMPKFSLEYGMSMIDPLAAMGLARAFDPGLADFTPMGSSPAGNIYISEVIQKVRIDVGEEGTEAAAATIVMMPAGAAPNAEEPLNLTLDSPFVFAVVDLKTGIPLFIGCLDDPSLCIPR